MVCPQTMNHQCSFAFIVDIRLKWNLIHSYADDKTSCTAVRLYTISLDMNDRFKLIRLGLKCTFKKLIAFKSVFLHLSGLWSVYTRQACFAALWDHGSAKCGAQYCARPYVVPSVVGSTKTSLLFLLCSVAWAVGLFALLILVVWVITASLQPVIIVFLRHHLLLFRAMQLS